MNVFDRILLILASACLSLIGIIFFSGELSSKYTTPDPQSQDIKVKKEKNSTVKTDQQNDMIIYSQEIEEAISTYFQKLKSNPEIDEEEKRLVDEVFPEADNSPAPTPSKKPQKVKRKETKANYIEYTVRKGDSLWRLSSKFKIPLYTIISANPHKSKQIIHPGDRLKIPTQKGLVYKVKKGDSLSQIAKKYKTNAANVRKINNLTSSRLRAGQTLFLANVKPRPRIRYKYTNQFVWPLKGRVTSGYGWRKHPLFKKRHFHEGIDIGAQRGTKIRAIAKGVVIHSGKSGGYGRLVMLRHKNNYISVYAHCSKIYTKVGRVVNKGQIIAKVGSSGASTGSHLHFEIKRYKKRINPVVALKRKIRIATTSGQ